MKNHMNASLSQKQLVLEMIALSGEYPKENLCNLVISSTYGEKVIKILKKNGLIKSFNKDKLKGYRLTVEGRKFLLENKPERFNRVFDNANAVNRAGSDTQKRIRLHLAAEVYTLICKSGALIFQDEKPAIFKEVNELAPAVEERIDWDSKEEVRKASPHSPPASPLSPRDGTPAVVVRSGKSSEGEVREAFPPTSPPSKSIRSTPLSFPTAHTSAEDGRRGPGRKGEERQASPLYPQPPIPTSIIGKNGSEDGEGRGRITKACFYSARELKAKADSNSIRASRAVGVLLTPTMVYAVYNTGKAVLSYTSHANSKLKFKGKEKPKAVPWRHQVETRFRVHLQTEVCRRLFPGQYKHSDVGAIMVGCSMDTLRAYMNPETHSQRNSKIFLTKGCTPFYFITNDRNGVVQLQFLTNPEKRKAFEDDMRKSAQPQDRNSSIEHDVKTKDGKPVLFCCLLDVPRLDNFKNGLEVNGRTGVVICFDFQKELLSNYLGDRAEIMAMNTEKVVAKYGLIGQ